MSRDASAVYDMWRVVFAAAAEQQARLRGGMPPDAWEDLVEIFAPGEKPPPDFSAIASLLRPDDSSWVSDVSTPPAAG